MKIFRIDRPYNCWPEAATEALRSSDTATLNCLPARLVADSAVNRNDRPAFIPDFAREGWVVEVRPAIHIGRLGKFISPRFAGRYISDISLVGILTPKPEVREQNARLLGVEPLSGLYDSFDGAITAGIHFPYPKQSQPEEVANREARESNVEPVSEETADRPSLKISAEFSCEGETLTKEIEIYLADLHPEETVALISRFTMLKSGDMIIPATLPIQFPIILNSSLTATLNSQPALSLRLK